MHEIMEHLAKNPVLVLFLLIGVGMLVGHIKIKGISLGAAAVLFAGIALGAYADYLGVDLKLPQLLGTLGLAIFTFSIGVSSGPGFFQVIKTAAGPLLAMLGVFIVSAGAAQALGRAFGMNSALIAGTWAGAITNTPALAAAGNAAQTAGDPDGTATATVGYAVAYLFGVIGMLFFASLALRYRAKDTDAPTPIINATIRVERRDNLTLAQILKDLDAGSDLRFSRLARGEDKPIKTPHLTDRVYHDDLLTVVGTEDKVKAAQDLLGHHSSHSLIADRRYLDFRRITVSNSKLAGRTLAEVDLDHRFDASVSRVRRGDVDLMADPRLVLQMGDRLRVVGPTHRLAEVTKYFGDSARGLSSLSPVALGLGMALGIFFGEYKFLTPTGATFSIGSAAGTLIVGLIFGRLGRIGKMVTSLPATTTQVLSELGLLIFLAQAGTKAGTQIGVAFTSGSWINILIVGIVVTTIVGAGLYASMRWLVKMGGTRLSGLLAGAQTQPAVLAFANDRTGMDPRVALGYAMVYPVAMVAKIFIAQIMGGL